MQLLTYIIPEQSLLLRSSPFVSGSQPPAPSVLDRSATAAAPASAPRTGASRDHGLGSAQASHARAHVSGQASSGPHDHRPLPPSGQIMWLSNSIFNLVFRFGATKPKLSVPCSLSHAGCKYLT